MRNGTEELDVLIVGAGISGLSMAAHMRMLCPHRSYAVIERRERLGGTWDLFRYPGVRSDSDMHTLGFRFEPWIADEAIADGDAILSYLDHVADKYCIRENIRFGARVIAADWNSIAGRWNVTIEDAEGWYTLACQFLYLASGYYDYDEPHDAGFAGQADFAGRIVHPQFWPGELDYAGKRVVVIGSGATAVTMVPAMAKQAAHVTMLQRTPTWMAASPSRDRLANALRSLLPARLAYRLIRWKNITVHGWFFNRSRKAPEKVAPWLTEQVKKALGTHYSERNFLPPYPPWDQRLCLVPDGDLFEAVTEGKASVITGRVERFEKDGVRLQSGALVEADIVVTATGLKLALGGQIDLSMDGRRIDFTDHWVYRSCMFSNVPNLVAVFGYLNAAWTLRADNDADYTCRVLNAMESKGADVVRPALPENHGLEPVDPIPFSSGYLQRARPLFPKMAAALPWRLNQDYAEDCRDLRQVPVEDGILRFEHVADAREIA